METNSYEREPEIGCNVCFLDEDRHDSILTVTAPQLPAITLFDHRFDQSRIWVRLGEHNFDLPNESRHVDLRVAQFRTHRDFDKRTFTNDIALLLLERPVQFTSFIKPVCLPPPGDLFVGVSGTVVGEWVSRYVYCLCNSRIVL